MSSGHLFLYRGLLGSRIGQGDAFLDYGSGNGRVLLHAARFPFGRVIGLDLDEDALQVARANVSVAASRRRCKRIEVITGDATVWPVPDDVTYIYMFNPFRGEVFRAMLDRVVESLDRRPRPLTIIYAHPTCAEDLLRDRALRPRADQPRPAARDVQPAHRDLPGRGPGHVRRPLAAAAWGATRVSA